MSSEDFVYYFDQRMTRDWAEALAKAQAEKEYRRDDQTFPRVAYGSETFRNPIEAEAEPCRHCCTIAGMLHDPGCDYEQCPRCNTQIMSCDCEFDGHEWKQD